MHGHQACGGEPHWSGTLHGAQVILRGSQQDGLKRAVMWRNLFPYRSEPAPDEVDIRLGTGVPAA